MRLYHGTHERNQDSILEHGIRPRGSSSSNWEAASSEDAVYLTKAYSLYFGSSTVKKPDERFIIVEIDTDLLPSPDKLLADEDAILFAWSRGANVHVPDEDWLKTQDKHVQAAHLAGFLEDFAYQGLDAEWSLKVMGNCTYNDVIPPTAITRILSYDVRDAWWIAFHDPVVSPLNYMYRGDDFEATQLVVADRLEEAHALAALKGTVTTDLDWVEELCSAHRTLVYSRDPSTAASISPAP